MTSSLASAIRNPLDPQHGCFELLIILHAVTHALTIVLDQSDGARHSALATLGVRGRFRLKIPVVYELRYAPKHVFTVSMGS